MIGLGPGSELGGFVIEAVAGRGGMGVVYRARQLRPGRTVALKVIAPEFARDPAFRARFERESDIAAQIEHPNVIPVYAVGEDQEVLYIAMRYVEGTDLREVLSSRGRLDPQYAAGIVDQVAHALDAAHARGLVHRDVKPSNVLLATGAGGEHPYLTDFGLARHADATTQGLTATGVMVGTIDYVAPEQVRGEAVDARTDIYSLGCLLFETLTGRVPFPRDNDIAKLYAHSAAPPPSARELLPELPAALDDVLARAMAKAAEDRYLSAGDFGRAARAAAVGERLSRAERSVAHGAAAPAAAAHVQAAPPVASETSDAPTAPIPAAAPPTAPAAQAAQPAPVSQPAPAAATFQPGPTFATPTAPAGAPPREQGRRRWPLFAGLAAAAAAIVVAVVLLAGGGGGGGDEKTSSTAAVPPGDKLVEQRMLTAPHDLKYTVALSVPESAGNSSAKVPLTMSLLGAKGSEPLRVVQRKQLPAPPYDFAGNSYISEFQLSPNKDGSGQVDLSWYLHPGDSSNKTCYSGVSLAGISLYSCG